MQRILMVDDEPRVLDGYRRTLGRRFQITTAVSGPAGLDMLSAARADGEPFAVVVSDMMMPGMNGAQFLAGACRLDGDLVPLVLSGQADMPSTIAAVNGADLFRFVEKPADTATLARAIQDALRHHAMTLAERDLMSRTLGGAVDVLTELLFVASPETIARSRRITLIAEAAAITLGLEDSWRLRLAACLSQVGCVGLPPDVVRRAHFGGALDPDEAAQYEGHRDIAGKMVARIPRLEEVSRWISHQPLYADEPPAEELSGAGLVFAGAVAFVAAQDLTGSVSDAGDLLRRTRAYPPGLVEAFEHSARTRGSWDATDDVPS